MNQLGLESASHPADLGTVELVTLLLMLANLATVHRPEVSHVLGPVHGLAYSITIIAAVLVIGGGHRVWPLALIPGPSSLISCRFGSECLSG
ncbi:hypothetical protein [Raineyella sp. W15-4]|uniref:hypothetical protein n=1 Tax=Raineyella sp. W15-4 TaxID=3081651 RepID=UPI00295444B2|nr:hypothetical protein [Raineyella sp. W15-4]WOQ17648.1 hypothetical protein R0145_02750 [Raineyella sp. W15-4]